MREVTKILFVSDSHYGLKSGGFDRTPEIHRVMNQAVDIAIKERVDLFVHGGDIGHTSNPPSYIHGLWVELFLKLENAGIKSRFLLGNHDAVHREGFGFGSLSPLAELDLRNVYSVVVPHTEMIKDTYVIYLPFVSRANVPGKLEINDYMDRFVDGIRDDIELAKGNTIVFTHLNPGEIKVNDDFILRPVEATVPDKLFEMDILGCFSGHIHKPQKIDKHWLVGSPIVTDFGDSGNKRFLLIEIDNGMKVKDIPSGAMNLVQLEYDFVGAESVKLWFDKEKIKGAGVKVKVRITENQKDLVDLDRFRKKLLDIGAEFVKKITPTIIRGDDKENVIVNPAMTDREAVESWIKTRKPSNKNAVMENALKTLEEAV